MSMDSGIVWVSFGSDRKSVDGRWHIRHPENSPSGRWELYDMKAGTWHGDWRTCTQAKKQAAIVVARTGDGAL
ncbi:hypothetical protein BST28_18650 [Mycolicibacter kumamotonensis]|uniref:Uncharacterized protein n=1 Tax=Mycolicibacter kumamotonensis TaxID=354243 RepID=A0A1X0DXW7_9MYCO|nr:hypothetical protein [Mycolicibacter kumamotonensis]ORA77286.1 hypothetical protein BST28_18650 [Mycolicibacter kumamotonensis]